MSSHKSSPASFFAAALGFALLAFAGLAQASEAGRVVFAVGSAQVAGRAAAEGNAVAEGDELRTGADGYIYVRTVDHGLLILRPASRARIVTYHVDTKVPANTRIKLELLSGVARSVSGQAVKLARQNFRFNTPVAAIGVRGTDFTVYTDQHMSRVTVMSGGIVVSGFTGACSPDGSGPCENGASRELSASQVGQMLEVHHDQAVPQLMTASPSLAPDGAAPPRKDEPLSKDATPPSDAASRVSLDPKTASDLLNNANAIANKPPVVMPPTVTTPPVTETPVTEPGAGETPKVMSQIVWGRWQAVLDKPGTIDTAAVLAAGGKRVAQNSQYAVMRTKGEAWVAPQQGSVGFALKESDAIVRNEATGAYTAARLENGKLEVDFGKASFNTSFDLLSDAERFKLQAQGRVGSDGQLSGNGQFAYPTNMAVSGAVGPETAAYIFQSRLDDKRIASGVTFWGK